MVFLFYVYHILKVIFGFRLWVRFIPGYSKLLVIGSLHTLGLFRKTVSLFALQILVISLIAMTYLLE